MRINALPLVIVSGIAIATPAYAQLPIRVGAEAIRKTAAGAAGATKGTGLIGGGVWRFGKTFTKTRVLSDFPATILYLLLVQNVS